MAANSVDEVIKELEQLEKKLKSLDKQTEVSTGKFGQLAAFITATGDTPAQKRMASMKKIMYGFFPPGMFRLVNKTIVTLNTMEKTMQTAKKIGSVFTKSKIKDLKLEAKEMARLAKEQENMQTKAGRGRIKAGMRSTERSLARQFKANNDAMKQTMKSTLQHLPLTGPGMGRLAESGIRVAREKGGALKSSIGEAAAKGAIKYRKFMMGIAKKATPVLNMAFRYLVFAMLAVVGFMAFLAMAKVAFEVMQELGILDDLKEMGMFLVEILMAFFGLIGAFMAGDWTAVVDYLGAILDGVLGLLWGAMKIIFKVGLALVVGLFTGLLEGVWLMFTNETVRDSVFSILWKFGKILLLAYFVKYLAAQALLLIGIYAMPFMIIVGIGIALYAFGRWIAKKLGFFAQGGTVNTPLQVVGERGPELVSLPMGSRVHSNRKSRQMVGGSNTSNVFNITINAKDTSDAELRRIADKIGNMINNKVNRTTSSRTLG